MVWHDLWSKSLVLLLVVTLGLTLAPNARAQDGEDFVEVFAQALAEGVREEVSSQNAATDAPADGATVERAEKRPRKAPRAKKPKAAHRPDKNKALGLTKRALQIARKFADAATMLCVLSTFLVLLVISQILFTAFCLGTAPGRSERLELLYETARGRPITMALLGLVNAILWVVIMIVLLKAAPLRLFGLVAAAWFLYRLLEILCSHSLRRGRDLFDPSDTDFSTRRPVLIGSLVLWPSLFIPLLGQALGLLWLLQGLGAQVILRWRRSERSDSSEGAGGNLPVDGEPDEETKPPVNQSE